MKLNTILLSTGIAAACTLSAQAALVTGWSVSHGGASIQAGTESTASPTLGDNTAESADASSLYASFSTLTLASVGDTITLSGSVTMNGIDSAAGQFRLILFEGSWDATTGGYMAGNGTDSTSANLRYRSSGSFYSNTGSTAASGLDYVANTPSVALADNATYDFTMSLELLAGNEIAVSTSLTNAGNDYLETSWVDTAPNTLSISNVGFLSGGALNADQLLFQNVDVSLTSVPEPSTPALVGLAALGLILRRRR